jgi:hypothetical protein
MGSNYESLSKYYLEAFILVFNDDRILHLLGESFAMTGFGISQTNLASRRNRLPISIFVYSFEIGVQRPHLQFLLFVPDS